MAQIKHTVLGSSPLSIPGTDAKAQEYKDGDNRNAETLRDKVDSIQYISSLIRRHDADSIQHYGDSQINLSVRSDEGRIKEWRPMSAGKPGWFASNKGSPERQPDLHYC